MSLGRFKSRPITTAMLVWSLAAVVGFAARPAGKDRFVSEEAKLYWSLDRILAQGQADKAKQLVQTNERIACHLLANLLFVQLDLALELEDAEPISPRMGEILALLELVADEKLKRLAALTKSIKKGTNPFQSESGELAEALAAFVDAAESADPDEQIRLFQIAAQKCDELRLELGKIICTFKTAKAQRDKGELIDAFKNFSQTQELLDRWGYDTLIPAVLNGLGIALYRLGLLETAWQQFSTALEVARKQGNEREQGKALTNLSAVAIQTGNFRQAAEFLREAIARGKTSTRLLNLGAMQTYLRDYESALLTFQEALELAQKAKDLPRQVLAWNNIGAIYWLQGNHEQALYCLQRALEIARQTQDLFRTAPVHLTLGLVYTDLGEFELAEKHFVELLDISRQLGDRVREVGALIRLGFLRVRQTHWDDAVKILEEALQIAKQIDHLPSIALALFNLGVAYEGKRDYERALNYYCEALDLWQKTGDIWMLAWTWKNIGDAYRKLGDEGIEDKGKAWSRAVDAYWQSVRLMERVRERVGGEAMGAQFAQNASEPFYQLANLLAQMGRTEEAFEISERMRARALLELMQLASLLEQGTATFEAGKVYDELKQRIAELEGQLLRAMASPSPNRELIERLQKELADVRNEFEQQRDMLRLRRWQLLPTNRGQIDFNAWRQLKLPDDTAVLVYLVTEQRTLLFVLTSKEGVWQIRGFVLPVTKKQLEEDTAWLRERVEQRRPVGATLQRLYAALVKPAEKVLSGKRKLIVIPDGPLYAIPFQVLQDENGLYLIERFTIAYTPSLTTLWSLQKRKPSATSLARGIGAGGIRPPQNFGQVSPAPTNDCVSLRNSLKWQWTGIAVVNFGSNIEPLPYAREEVRWISELFAQTFPKSSIRVFVDASATKQIATQALKESRWVHFATHAILEPKRPLYSRLIFTPLKGQDNLLRAFEVLDLGQTPCEMVVLSACETGLGKALQGEGLIGLVWTFMAAGTKTLVASQWTVNDLSTAHLMRAYYKFLLNGLQPAEAMRRAQISLLSQRQFHHPYYWAAFVVWGSGF